ncbi:MAG: hypothetical protein C4316_12205 [Chloroflexota bacterium]
MPVGEDALLTARAVLWKAVGRGWAYPDAGLLEVFADGVFEGIIRAAWARVAGEDDPAAAGLADALRASLTGPVGLAEEHTFLFSGRVRCPPYASSYAADPDARTRVLGELGQVLEALRLRPAPDIRDLPDHIGVLMELVGQTLAREAELRAAGKAEKAAAWQECRRLLVTNYLGEWLDDFSGRLESTARLPFYPALGRFVVRLRNLEREMLGG